MGLLASNAFALSLGDTVNSNTIKMETTVNSTMKLSATKTDHTEYKINKTNGTDTVLVNKNSKVYGFKWSDKTPDIIKEFQLNYPLIIKPILNYKNIYSTGFRPINRFNFERAKGKYIALCEGDDYWCSISKLQIQVDLLEMQTDKNICFTNFCIVNSVGQIINNRVLKFKKYNFHYLELYYRNFIPNLTVLFRNTNELAQLDLTGYYPPDWYLHLFNNRYSTIVYIDEVIFYTVFCTDTSYPSSIVFIFINTTF